MSVSVPCQGCAERHPGCHSQCEKYQLFRAEHAKEKENIKAYRERTASIRFGSFLGDREILNYTKRRKKK